VGLIYDISRTEVLWSSVFWTVFVGILFALISIGGFLSKASESAKEWRNEFIFLTAATTLFLIGLAIFGGFYSRDRCLSVQKENLRAVEGVIRNLNYRSRDGSTSFQVADQSFLVSSAFPRACGFTKSLFEVQPVKNGDMVRIEFWEGKVLRVRR
jgi:hypothetical protein